MSDSSLFMYNIFNWLENKTKCSELNCDTHATCISFIVFHFHCGFITCHSYCLQILCTTIIHAIIVAWFFRYKSYHLHHVKAIGTRLFYQCKQSESLNQTAALLLLLLENLVRLDCWRYCTQTRAATSKYVLSYNTHCMYLALKI